MALVVSSQRRTEWRSVVLSDKIRFGFGANDGRVLVERRQKEHMWPNRLRPRHTGPIHLESCTVIHEHHSRWCFQQVNPHPHVDVVTQRALQSVDMLPLGMQDHNSVSN
ncbi:hypothetical protein TNCV_4567231 [Trichonephila clavipes]|nr:hypothetical protein TNCV_4567231 [Trichonephila clavipes]